MSVCVVFVGEDKLVGRDAAAVIRVQETSVVLWGSPGPEVQETLPSARVGGCEVGFREVGWLRDQRLPSSHLGNQVSQLWQK